MKKLSILLLLYLLFMGSANAARVELNDVRFSSRSTSNYVLDINNNEVNLTTLQQKSQFTSEADAVPPTPWIVGLGLCLVFLGYKIKTKSIKINHD
jgi:hypothetical protein